MTRLPDWRERLADLVAQAHRTPFAYGARDCCLWAADAVQAVTGVDLAADVRGTYADQGGAQRVLMALGGLRGVASRAGNRIAPMRAQAGDIGIVRGERTALAVCQGEVWLCASRNGLHAVPLDAAVMAWGVGHA